MSIVNTTECIICYNEYDTERRKPCIGTCGHSICENCKHQMVSSKCPQCNREEAFAVTTINYQVLELIKHFKSMTAGEPIKQNRIINDASKAIDDGACSECTVRSPRLRICITCASQQNILKQDKKGGEWVLNIDEDGIEAAIERAKAIAICGDCALDSQQHEGHKTMQLAVLKNALDDRVQVTIVEKINKIEEDARVVLKAFEAKIAESRDQLLSYFQAHKNLKSEDRKLHFNHVEAHVQQIYNTISMVEDCNKRLDHLNNEIIDEKKHVEATNKVYSKSVVVFASAEPILVADRKQSAKEPLLIGTFKPKDKSWLPVGRMPNPKSNYAVANNKSQIFIVGGMNNGQWLNSLEMYDKDKNLRRDCNKMRRGRTRASAGFHNGKLFVAGGYDGTYMSSVEQYDTESGEWKDGPALQRPRADAMVVSCNGELFVLGGFNGKEYEEKIEKMNEITHKFEIFGEMNGSRAGFGACAFKGRIFIAGGWSNSSNTLKSVRSYDPITKSWRDEPSLNKDRKYFTLHATNEAIYAIRGCADSWSLINEIERLNFETGQWETILCTPLNSNSSNNSAAASPSSSINPQPAANA